MQDLFSVIAPVFGLIAVGWIAGRTGLVAPRTGEGLTDYLFALAIPALIVKTLTAGDLPHSNPWGYWVAYFGGVAITWAIGAVIVRRILKLDRTQEALMGFSASQSNTVLVGIPLILRAYGEEGAVPLFLLIAVHLPIMLTVATLLIEASGAEGGFRIVARRLVKTILTHPIVLALVAGVVLKWADLPPSGAVGSLIDSLAASASPCALVAMGLALYRHGIAGEIRTAAILSALKLVVHPLIVWFLAFHVFPVPPVWAGVAVLFAAMPTGVNAYILANRYGAGEHAISSTVALSTVLAVLTVSFWLVFLGVA